MSFHSEVSDRLTELDDVVLVDEAHLDVQLGELRLTVRAEVLVAIAAGDLVVALHPRDHEQLFEQLRALRQGVPGSGPQPSGHQEVAGSFRGRAGQRGRLDLDEVSLGQDGPRSLVHLAAQANGRSRTRAAKVEVAVLEPGLFADGDALVDLERQRGRRAQDLELGGNHLDLTGGQVLVGVALGAQAHLAGHLDAVLVTQVVRSALGEDLVTNDHLRHPRRITQVEEGHATVIAPTGNPPGQGDGLRKMWSARKVPAS